MVWKDLAPGEPWATLAVAPWLWFFEAFLDWWYLEIIETWLIYMEVSINGGYPQVRWLVYVRENPPKIRMRTGGTPMTQETSI